MEEDKARFSELYEAFWHYAYRGARERGVPHEEAEEAASRVFAKLLVAGPEAWRNRGARYFYSAGKHEAIDILRRVENRNRVDGGDWLERTPDPAPLDPELTSERSDTEAVREAIDALPEPLRAVVRMHWIEGWTQRRVAELLGVNVRSCKRYWREARQRLEKTLRHFRRDRSG